VQYQHANDFTIELDYLTIQRTQRNEAVIRRWPVNRSASVLHC